MILAVPSDTRIAHFLLDSVAADVTKFANQNASALINTIGPAASAMLSIYVIMWGLAVVSGQSGEPFGDGVRRILRMCAIVSFALTAGIYQSTISDFFLTIPSALAASMSNPEVGEVSGDPVTLATALDASLQKGVDIGNRVWSVGDKQGLLDGGGLAYYLLALIIYFSVASIVCIASGIIFVAFIATALLLSVGPIFVLMALLPATQKFFDLWLGQLVNYAILFILVACSVSMCFTMFDEFVKSLPTAIAAETVINTVKIVGATIVIVAVLIQTYGMAAALGGGAALSAQGVASRALQAGKAGAGAAVGAGRAVATGNSRSMSPLERQAQQSAGYRKSASETLALRSSIPAALNMARRVFRPPGT
jgi:type IV secretion system protein VirB6